MLHEYYLYLNLENTEYEIHRSDCEFMKEAVKNKLLEESVRLGYASNKQEMCDKYRNVYPSRVIVLPNCCD